MAPKFTVGLKDSSFIGHPSFTLGGMNSQETPMFVEWNRKTQQPVTAYTDMKLRDAIGAPGKKIGLLIEPPSLSWSAYKIAGELLGSSLDIVLTHNLGWAQGRWTQQVYYFPLGGSWIAPRLWGLHFKTLQFSIIASQKVRAPGHRMRHYVIDKLARDFGIHVWGRGYDPILTTADGLLDYRYSIIIESVRCPGYFSEKLIDCLSVGTIPLYWGDPKISDRFSNIPTWETLSDLEELLRNPPEISIERQARWLQKAWEFRCAEDWITQNYPGVWEEKQ